MAQLRGALQRDQDNNGGTGEPPNPLASLGGQDPNNQGGFSGAGGPQAGVGDPIDLGKGQSPRERLPGSGNNVNVGPPPEAPRIGPNAGGFAGGGSSTISPPSATMPAPPVMGMPLPAPAPESLVFPGGGGGGLLGKNGGLQGGGIGLPDSGQNSTDPSSLLLSLLQQLGR